MIEITSIQNQKIKDLSKLKEKKYQLESKQYLVEGFHMVDEASAAGLLQTVIATSEDILRNYNVEAIKVDSNIIKKLSQTVSPQPIIGVVKMKPDTSLAEHLNTLQQKRICMLDNIMDPGNLGSIIRTSAALGYNLVIISPESCSIYNNKVLRASQGSIYKIPIVRMKIIDGIKILKSHNVHIFATNLKAKNDILSFAKKENFAVVFGNEANGVSQEVLNVSDDQVVITMKNSVESLNVMVASAITMYELIKEKR